MSRRLEWYERHGTPEDGQWWWAVEHYGPVPAGGGSNVSLHPAFYLRSLMAGDFAGARLPLPRHVLTLDGQVTGETRCGTCGGVPEARMLEPIERRTGARGFLSEYRLGRQQWPAPTDPGTCWLCSNRSARAETDARVGDQDVKVCEGCSAFLLSREGR